VRIEKTAIERTRENSSPFGSTLKYFMPRRAFIKRSSAPSRRSLITKERIKVSIILYRKY